MRTLYAQKGRTDIFPPKGAPPLLFIPRSYMRLPLQGSCGRDMTPGAPQDPKTGSRILPAPGFLMVWGLFCREGSRWGASFAGKRKRACQPLLLAQLTRKPTLAETKSRSCEAAAVMAALPEMLSRTAKRSSRETRPMHETIVT